jgi:hypothetical protein
MAKGDLAMLIAYSKLSWSPASNVTVQYFAHDPGILLTGNVDMMSVAGQANKVIHGQGSISTRTIFYHKRHAWIVFSTMAATPRKLTSLPDPGANPITTFTGLVGCQAQAVLIVSVNTSASSRFMIFLSK